MRVYFDDGEREGTNFRNALTAWQVISPQLLILRVASGRGWDEETGWVRPSTLKFSHAAADPSVSTHSHCFENSGTTVNLETFSDKKETV